MGNSEKYQHGKSFQESIEHFVLSLNTDKKLCSLEIGKRLGYEEFDSEQFYIPYEIAFQDDTAWAVYSTTSMRDRFKCQLWDAYNVKQIDSRIECAWLVYPDSVSEKEKKNFQGKAKAIDDGMYYSSVDSIASETEFQLALEEKAMSSAGLSGGVRGDRRGRGFEKLVENVMNHNGNLSLLKKGAASFEAGYAFVLFEKIVGASGVDVDRISCISATSDIPPLPSGGPGKTDVIVSYRMSDGEVVEQKISCKRTLKDKVSVSQYSAAEILRVLAIADDDDVAKAIMMYQECGSGKALKEKYGTSGYGFVLDAIEQGLTREDLYTLTKWVVSGYGVDNPDINCADYILIRRGAGSECTDSIYDIEEYVGILLDGEPLQMGTPFDWTFASGQRGKSIQFKMRISH